MMNYYLNIIDNKFNMLMDKSLINILEKIVNFFLLII